LNLPASRARCRCSSSSSVEARLVDRHAALAADVGRQVDGEAVGVVQLERGVAVDLRRARHERTLEDLHAVRDRAEEGLLPPVFSTSIARWPCWRSSG
jgi:hypothetical protein